MRVTGPPLRLPESPQLTRRSHVFSVVVCDGFVRACGQWGVVRQIAFDIALGLQHLHQHQVIHRDLKSPNFLVDRHTLRVKICDFGLSRLRESTLKMTGGRGTGT